MTTSLQLRILLWVLLQGFISLGRSWWPPNEADEFHQKTERFWAFQEESGLWAQIKLPYDLISCSASSCRQVATIQGSEEEELPVRKGVSLTRMSETSIWVTGQSGRIYERFWNGVKWVAAPHDLPIDAGRAVGTFAVDQSIFALSEAGKLYKLQMGEDNLPCWVVDEESSSVERLRLGVPSHDHKKLYVSTMNGSLLEFDEARAIRWYDHGKPPGGDVVFLIDANNIRSGMIFAASSSGELYEFNKNTKPQWRKHVGTHKSLMNGFLGERSSSLFLLTKEGLLVERRFHQRKWKWVTHGAPKGQTLTAITPFSHTETEDKFSSMFLTTATGHVFEHSVDMQEGWIDHMHPCHAKVARGVSGIQLQFGRIVFPLDDGRLGELRLFGARRKTRQKYEWSILEVPETEGWNEEYCTEERGAKNCIAGNEFNDEGITTMKRRKTEECAPYIPLIGRERSTVESPETWNFQTEVTGACFRLRAMHADESFLFTTGGGLIFEYLYEENVWFWLRHEDLTPITGALGSYNGSLFLVDIHGNLLMIERNVMELSMINCTAMKKGRRVTAGAPWDGAHGNLRRTIDDDALFFVSKKGRLLQFTVAYRRFRWKDCHHPPGTKIAFILDQEFLRMNVVFVVGTDGRLYQYNRVTKLWHRHCQSPHLMLKKLPATAIRQSLESLVGSLFMVSENGGLVEYHWSSEDGWRWIEHGFPNRNLTFVGAPGPSTLGSQLFLVGSDGQVYHRYMDQNTWKWKSHGYPYQTNVSEEFKQTIAETGLDMENEEADVVLSSCDEKVAAVRPIRLSEDSMIFELRDGRLAELRRSRGITGDWEWSRIIGTPTSNCATGYWTTLDS